MVTTPGGGLIGDGTIDTADLADDAVTGAKVADNAIDSTHIAAGAVDNEHLAADIVTGDEIADASIGSEHITDSSVTPSKIDRQILLVEYNRSSNTAAGGSTSGSWQDRTIDTEVVNTITGASLSSNQITLPAGTYEVTGWCTSFRTGATGSRLRDSGDTTTYAIASSAYGDTSDGDNILNHFENYFTLGSSTTLDLQTYSNSTQGTDGFGRAANTGEQEIYVRLKFVKVS